MRVPGRQLPPPPSFNVLVPRPATMEKQKQWANKVAWCIFRTEDLDTVARGQ